MWVGSIICKFNWNKKVQKILLRSLNKNNLERIPDRKACLAIIHKIIIQASIKITIPIKEFLLYRTTPARYSVNTGYSTILIKVHQLVQIINYPILSQSSIQLFSNLQKWSIPPLEQSLSLKISHSSQWLFLWLLVTYRQ